MSQSAPDSELLCQGIVSIKGMTIRQAMFRLAKVIAIVKPPIRSWNWVAEWLAGHGVVSERGGPIKGSTLKLYWQEVKKAGLVDAAMTEKTVEMLKASLLADESIEAVLEKALRSGEVRAESALRSIPKPSREQRVVSGKPGKMPALMAEDRSLPPSAPAVPDLDDPGFEEIRAAILENMGRPESRRLAMIQVGDKQMIIPIAAQAKVRDGKITSREELHQAMSKRR